MRQVWIAAALLLAACGDKNDSTVDASSPGTDALVHDAPAVTPDGGNSLTPDKLADTGLCTDAACTAFSPDVHEYTPRWALWADGATKRRWFSLPPGTKIDTSDMNYWKFPIGTKFWKEFTRDGVRVETRYIVKVNEEDAAPPATTWFYVSYQWNAAENDTTAVPNGVMNANGTQHDIPSRVMCKQCHDGLKGVDGFRGRVLGFGALQLDADSGFDLEDLISQNLLTNPPTGGAAHARFPLPGTATDIAAYGYLHANCGHCHNPTSPTYQGVTNIVLRYDVDHLGSVADMPQFKTTVGYAAMVPFDENSVHYDTIVKPHDPAGSAMIARMNSTSSSRHMPQIGSEIVDPDGQTKLLAWINSLQ